MRPCNDIKFYAYYLGGLLRRFFVTKEGNMKRILLSFLAVFMLFATACAQLATSPTPSPDPNSGNASGEQLNTETFIYVGYRYLQYNGDNYDYVTQKVPIVAVNKLGEYLVDIAFFVCCIE